LKILVTGATGFIGPHVLEQLVDKGHVVTATARSAEKAARFSWFSKVKFVAFDFNELSSSQNIYELFGKPELLVHLAWEGLPNYRAAFHLKKNLPQQAAFLKQMVKSGLPSLTVTGTCLEYGMKTGRLSEDMPAAPVVVYAEAKNRLLGYLWEWQKTFALQWKWIRLFYTYGRGQNENAILAQLDKALERGDKIFNMSKGQQLRDYLPVEKMAQYIVKIALQQRVTGIINCCSGQSVSIKKLVEDYLALKKKSIQLNLGFYPYLDYEPMAFWGDTRKLKEAVGG
jgi:dTDP-6-deoxy-L-talose 4-dehydrogenase (NAD+)